jgi:hypothetical protein
MKKLFLAWQGSKSRHWFPIGQLTFDGKNYHFVYTHGVNKILTRNFNCNINVTSLAQPNYKSQETSRHY